MSVDRMTNDHTIEAAVRQFDIGGEFVYAMAYGSGHINDTYLALFDQAGAPARYIVQRINRTIFKNPGAMMENIQRVTAHLAAAVAGEPDSGRHVLTLIPVRDGRAWHVDADGEYWRAYQFIEGARTYDAVENADQAYQAAKAFGRFQKLLKLALSAQFTILTKLCRFHPFLLLCTGHFMSECPNPVRHATTSTGRLR